MYTNGPVSPFPLSYMQDYYSGDMANVSQKSNQWSGNNNQRYINEEYNALYDECAATTDMERATELFIQMNDIVINDYATVPEVSRSAEKYAYSGELVAENVSGSGWEPLYWNIANWTAITK